ncbi:hypothetical protein SVAN01_10467 [Stagonosporopsis vannaccii]|nr:hypothetical protein SVAN01_10467 [Stagonosporopsis vannaccii]
MEGSCRLELAQFEVTVVVIISTAGLDDEASLADEKTRAWSAQVGRSVGAHFRATRVRGLDADLVSTSARGRHPGLRETLFLPCLVEGPVDRRAKGEVLR